MEKYKTESISINKLNPHPKNYRVHPEDQLRHIIKSIESYGIYKNIVVAKDYTILAGHGVIEAAKILNIETVPIIKLEIDPNCSAAIKLLTGDNEVAGLGEVNDRLLLELLTEIKDNDSEGLIGTGYTDQMLASLDFDVFGQDDYYSKKLGTIVYEPNDRKPEPNELCDKTKADELIQGIENSKNLSEAEREFLIRAAQRHVVFNYSDIADFYSNSDDEVKKLMEESALVIIDYDRAIELGYTNLTKEIIDIMNEDHA